MKEKINKQMLKIKKSLRESFNFINKKNKFNTMEVIAIMIITVIFGMFVGGILMYRKGSINTGIKRQLNEFVDTYTEILNEYYEKVDEEGLLEAGINGMVNYLGDPYSVFMDEEASEEFNEKVNGEYVGIGTEIIQYTDSKIEFLNVYPDGPAYEAGIRNGDILIKVDDKEVVNKSLNEVSNLVKGKEGTTVKITITRGEEEKEFIVTRKNIDIESVFGEIIEYNDTKIGYMLIDIFAANTNKQFEKELKRLEEAKIDSLIIDVRSNNGGYLSTVTDIVSLFTEKNEIIYRLKTKDKIEKIYDETNENRDYQIVVLINGASASASELLTAALMELEDAYVVGTKSYGKSKVQKTHGLSNGSSIKYTFQEWLTPSGESVGDKGIKPTHEVSYIASDEENKYDSQLQKALDLLTGVVDGGENDEENNN